jgi:hypothetical protein
VCASEQTFVTRASILRRRCKRSLTKRENLMRSTHVLAAGLTVAGLLALAVSAVYAQGTPDNQPAPMVMLVPVEISMPAMKAGCWAQLYDERNFKGEIFTIAGPIQIDSTTKSAGRHLRGSVDSLVTGPKAVLTVFEHSMFKDKAVKFEPNSKEAGLIKKLGAAGRIQSLKLDCAA